MKRNLAQLGLVLAIIAQLLGAPGAAWAQAGGGDVAYGEITSFSPSSPAMPTRASSGSQLVNSMSSVMLLVWDAVHGRVGSWIDVPAATLLQGKGYRVVDIFRPSGRSLFGGCTEDSIFSGLRDSSAAGWENFPSDLELYDRMRQVHAVWLAVISEDEMTARTENRNNGLSGTVRIGGQDVTIGTNRSSTQVDLRYSFRLYNIFGQVEEVAYGDAKTWSTDVSSNDVQSPRLQAYLRRSGHTDSGDRFLMGRLESLFRRIGPPPVM